MGAAFIIWLQQFSSPFIDSIFQGITMVGEDIFYILILTFIYWCINKEFGSRLAFVFFFSMCFNSLLKVTIQAPRPIGSDGIRSLREHTATGYSFPSGHTQSTATLWYYLARTIRKPWLTAMAVIIIILMALSRLYLGVHWPRDVIGAVIIAVLLVHLGGRFYDLTIAKRSYLIPSLLVVLIIPAALVSGDKDFITIAALITGTTIGFALEQYAVHFTIPASYKRRLFNYLSGLIMILIIKEGGKIILPSTSWADFLRYTLIGFGAIAGAPWVFMITERITKKNN